MSHLSRRTDPFQIQHQLLGVVPVGQFSLDTVNSPSVGCRFLLVKLLLQQPRLLLSELDIDLLAAARSAAGLARYK